jgi:hypothetical protein
VLAMCSSMLLWMALATGTDHDVQVGTSDDRGDVAATHVLIPHCEMTSKSLMRNLFSS